MPTTAADPTTDFITSWDAFFRAVNRARGRAASAAAPGTLSTPQFNLLAPLAGGEPVPVGQLAIEAGVAAPTATRMLDGLARAGYVERQPAERDRRVVLIALTDAGAQALAVKEARMEAARRRIHAGLTPDEREQATALLRRLAEVMDEL